MPADLATRTLFILPERLTEAQFYASLATFTLKNWHPHPTIISPWVPAPVPAPYDPVEAGISMDLHYLYVVVLSLGGYQAIEDSQRWSLVALKMSLWPEDLDQPREVYRKYLWYYEVYSRQVRRLFVARKRKNRDPREYSVQEIIKGQEENDREDYHVSCLPWSAIDSRLELQKRGVVDGTLVLSDYFSLSPAVQLSIKQQTYLRALEIFTNPREGVTAIFTPPASIRPSSSASLDENQDDNSLDGEFLSEDVKRYKNSILQENRNHILRTQIHMLPQRLPRSTSAELARFIYDEVNLSSRRLQEPAKIDPNIAEIVEKFGFGSGPSGREPKSYSPASSHNGEEVTLSEYYDRDYMVDSMEMKAWKVELIEKYGFKPRVHRPVELPRVEKEGLNFHEYTLAYGPEAPEVQHFFNQRLKLEGGFWGHELERMQALERRVRGEDETLGKGWDKASSVGSINIDNNPEPDSQQSYLPHSFLPPGLMEVPMSLHDYARRIAKYCQEPVEWGYITPAESLREVIISVPASEYLEMNPNISVFPTTSMEPRKLRETDLQKRSRAEHTQKHQAFAGNAINYEIQKYEQDTLGILEFAASAASADGFQVGGQNYPEGYAQSDISIASGEEIRIFSDPNPTSDGSTRKILSLPSGVQFDITNVNPLNPPSYNYAQQWLQGRASHNSEMWQEDINQWNAEHHATAISDPTEEMLIDIHNLINRPTTADPLKAGTSSLKMVYDHEVIDDGRKIRLSPSERLLLENVFNYENNETKSCGDDEWGVSEYEGEEGEEIEEGEEREEIEENSI